MSAVIQVSLSSWRGAGADHSCKRVVDAEPPVLAAQLPAQAAVDPRPPGAQDAARIRRPPEDGLADAKPREDALAIRGQQARRRQVAAKGQQPVGVGKR